jgi:hypothetical protein
MTKSSPIFSSLAKVYIYIYTSYLVHRDFVEYRGDIIHTLKCNIIPYAVALSGGVFPVSAVLASDEVMLNIKPGQHGT